jgi:uncharacterized protein (TIGR03435 family)
MRVALAVLAFTVLRVSAQTASFEVISIRPHVDAPQPDTGKRGRGMRTTLSGPRITFTSATLPQLVTFAYNLKTYEASGSGLPNWSATQFDIAAKAEGDAALTRDQFRPLVRALLADRFGLKFH